MLRRTFLFVILANSLFTGCNKDDEFVNRERILGTWISEDHNDTLDFTDKSGFYRNGDHFEYTL